MYNLYWSITNPKCYLVHDDGPTDDGPDNVSSDDDCEDTNEPFVVTSQSGAYRKWDKYSYCLFCDVRQTKLLRHCRTIHPKEIEVARALALEEDNQKEAADKIWTKVRNLGNHHHNKEVFAGKCFDLVVKKRPTKGKKVRIQKYVPCLDCFGYYHCKTLWSHRKICPLRSKTSPKKARHVKEGRALLPTAGNISKPLKVVLDRMTPDDITLIAKADVDIVNVGNKVFEESNSSRRGDLVREKMRSLAKLLKVTRDSNKKISAAADLVTPWAFNTTVNGARFLSGYNEETQEHERYSDALHMGYAVKDLALIVRGRYIKEGIKDKATEVDEFLKLKEIEWKSKDAIKKNGTDVQSYKELAKVTASQIVFFNRRRPREVESITIEEYLKQVREGHEIQDEVQMSMTTAEKIAMGRLTLLMVRGKRGRGVPVLLTKDMRESIDILFDFNQKHNSHQKFIFSRVSESATTPLRAYDCMTEMANQANLDQPEHIRTTKLRKQIATVTQVLGLKENELEQLANHMGHDIKIHREYYRLPQECLMLAKVSKLLLLADKGELHKFKGKSLDEIDITPEDTVGEEQNESDESESATDTDDVNATEGDSQTDVPGPSSANTTEAGPSGCPSYSTVGRKYNKWTKPQEDFLFSQQIIKKHLKRKTAPGRIEGEFTIKKKQGTAL
ncbi:hypothetical protein HOLleu_20819 [Holothuria leucospilota]|uniref:Uncharacterized protein n=1 Tax=Holothuria leucospilota TaxID=206669 RepID=A0A9Q1BVK1_HOLLE|nr:hypothetical protein HOLleu_20819 [Holothuria leucospilota]